MLAGKSLAENFPMLGLGRAAVPGGSPLQFGDQPIVQVAYV